MTVLSGKYGAVNGQSTVHNFQINEEEELSPYPASNTKAGTPRLKGIYDYTGSFEGYGGQPPVLPGQYFNFVGFTAPNTGARGTAGESVEFTNGLCTDIVVRWNWTQGLIINWTANFANGTGAALTRDAADTTVDNSGLVAPSVCDGKIQHGDAVPEVDWANVTEIELAITCNPKPYVNSSTACGRARRRGHIDYTVAVTEQTTRPLFNVGDDVRLKIFTAAATFWVLEWGKATGNSNFQVNVDTGDIISQTVNFEMSGFKESDKTEGQIILPDTNVWWPTAYIAYTNP